MSLARLYREDRPVSVLLGGSGIRRIAVQQTPKVGALLQAPPVLAIY